MGTIFRASIDLPHAHVRERHVRDLPLGAEPRELADAVGEGYGRIGRVKLVDVDPRDAERFEAALARFAQMGGARVSRPGAVGALESPLGRHDGVRPLFLAESARDEPLVVADVAVIEAVDVGRVDEGDPRVERGVDRADRVVLGGTIADREVHAAKAYRADREAAATEGSRFHRWSSSRRSGGQPSARTSSRSRNASHHRRSEAGSAHGSATICVTFWFCGARAGSPSSHATAV